MLGHEYSKKSTAVAVLNANYIMERLKDHYKMAFRGESGLCAHEFILGNKIYSFINLFLYFIYD
jgi:glycine dehydrogenase